MYKVRVSIDLKEGISDPEGANTLKALRLLGFDSVKSAKMSKNLCLVIDKGDEKKVRKDVEEMCQKLLINPVIHDYHIEITEMN
jgi:phosphoribosylformylglycinamidine synthase